MIKSLYIKNFALIDELEVNFSNGLNILTGETGAGKSILIDAIDLAFGARASKEQIKNGESKALIELQVILSDKFPKNKLEENGIDIDEDNVLIFSREISQTGTRSRINGILVTQNYIQELREKIIDIHSQHETYTYIQPKTHIDLLDGYGDTVHLSLYKQFTEIFNEYSTITKKYNDSISQITDKEQKIDFLNYQITEIEGANISDINEYELLVQEREILVNSEELKNLAFSSYDCLYGQENSIIDVLNKLESKIQKGLRHDKAFSDILEMISTSSTNLKEAANELSNYAENLDLNPQRLAEIEDRIDILDKLKRKFGPTLENVLLNLEKFHAELDEININSGNIDSLFKKMTELKDNIEILSKKLTKSRQALGEKLSLIIQKELINLEMPNARFSIKIDKKEDITSKGIDNVEFLFSANAGEPLKSLAKIASGGEISRVMLAIKTIFARADEVNTVIFDEIDTGISGKASQAVAEKLAELAYSHQILCITHQPIIAAMADNYLYIEKVQTDNKTSVKVSSLDENAVITAISRLASGSGDDEDSINFASKLVNQGKEFKKAISKDITTIHTLVHQ